VLTYRVSLDARTEWWLLELKCISVEGKDFERAVAVDMIWRHREDSMRF
jgi:hypothetical protein